MFPLRTRPCSLFMTCGAQTTQTWPWKHDVLTFFSDSPRCHMFFSLLWVLWICCLPQRCCCSRIGLLSVCPLLLPPSSLLSADSQWIKKSIGHKENDDQCYLHCPAFICLYRPGAPTRCCCCWCQGIPNKSQPHLIKPSRLAAWTLTCGSLSRAGVTREATGGLQRQDMSSLWGFKVSHSKLENFRILILILHESRRLVSRD